MKKNKIENYWYEILKEIGEDPERNGLLETPKRIAKMYTEIFRGYHADPPKVTSFPREQSQGLIIDIGYYYSVCEHHGILFFGNYYYGYIPGDLIIGASKIGRIVDHFSAKMQIAERLCADVVEYIEKNIDPLGSILIMNGRHLCKEMRGLKKHNSPFEAIEARGIFLTNKDGCKDEFMSRIMRRI